MIFKQARDGRWRKWLLIASAVVIVAEGSVLAKIIQRRNRAEKSLAKQKHLAVKDAKVIASRREVRSFVELPSSTTFSEFLENQGFQADTVYELVQDTRPVYDLARVRAGNQVTFINSGAGQLKEIDYQIDLDHMLDIRKAGDKFAANVRSIPYAVGLTGVSGTVHDSLFIAIEDAGEEDQLAIAIADIFGWDFDFNTDTQNGDKFEVLVEKKALNGKFVGYGRVLAAEYDSGGQHYQTVLFRDPSGQSGYYAPDGKALKKAFLRSPLTFAAPITSRFSYHRFHPILKRYRAHLGIDYGAPVGSKVQAVADGRVEVAGWHGGSGKEIRLRHARGYQTYYLHLSRILVHPGQHVHQGQIIGLTGATGLATGPHLDFRIAQDGKFRNFLGLKLPPAQSVARKDWARFLKVQEPLLGQLASLRSHEGGVEQATLQQTSANSSQGQ